MKKNEQKEFFKMLKEEPNKIYERLIRNGKQKSEEEIEILSNDANTAKDYTIAYESECNNIEKITTLLLKHICFTENKISEEELEKYQDQVRIITQNMYLNKQAMEEYLTLIKKVFAYVKENSDRIPYHIQSRLLRIKEYIENITSSEIVRNHISILKAAQSKGVACKIYNPEYDDNFLVQHYSPRTSYSKSPEFISVTSLYNEQSKNNDILIKIYATIKKDKITEVMSDIMVLANDNKIPIYYKTRPFETNDMLTIRLERIEHLDLMVEFLKKNPNIITPNHPFMPMFDGVGITLDQGGSYNKFISDRISEFISKNENGTYEEFILYLTSNQASMYQEEQLFMKNLLLSSQEGLTIEDFKKIYKITMEELEYKKDIEQLEKALYNEKALSIISEDKNTKIENILLYLVSKYFNNKTPEEVLFEITGEHTIKEYIENSYRRILKEYKDGKRNSGYRESCYYFTKLLAEKWVSKTGAKYAESGVRAFKLLYEDNQTSNRYKNAKLKYGEDFETFMAETSGVISYSYFKDLTNSHIKNSQAQQETEELKNKK